ncbi:VanZ family protein [Candidatus Omnitrophota bacterium]
MNPTKNLFSSFLKNLEDPIPFWIGAYIILSASFARQLFDLLGSSFITTVLSIVLVMTAIILYYYFFPRENMSLSRILISSNIFIILILFILYVKYPSEKMHFIEYALLGFFTARACKSNITVTLSTAILFTLIISFNDEFFQLLLPYRRYDLRDIIFNFMSGSAGGVLLLLRRK